MLPNWSKGNILLLREVTQKGSTSNRFGQEAAQKCNTQRPKPECKSMSQFSSRTCVKMVTDKPVTQVLAVSPGQHQGLHWAGSTSNQRRNLGCKGNTSAPLSFYPIKSFFPKRPRSESPTVHVPKTQWGRTGRDESLESLKP